MNETRACGEIKLSNRLSASYFGKIFDIIFINRHYDDLSTSELQFGFKKKRSTNHCSMVLKETIAYYVQQDSMAYCILLTGKYCIFVR
jgi:hypothetical protein